MKRSRIIDQVPKDLKLPEAPGKQQQSRAAADLSSQELQVRNLSSRAKIRVRSPMFLPSRIDQVFQKPPEGPVSTSWAPEHLEDRSLPSVHNRFSSPVPSDAEGQPGDSYLWLEEQELEAYKKEKTAAEEGIDCSGRESCPVLEVTVSESEEFESTEEFEEGDEVQALSYFTQRAVVRSPHNTRSVAIAAEAWRRKEQLKVHEIRRAELQRSENSEGGAVDQQCCVREVKVCFKEISIFARRVLFPCDHEFDPEIEIDDSESESESEEDSD